MCRPYGPAAARATRPADGRRHRSGAAAVRGGPGCPAVIRRRTPRPAASRCSALVLAACSSPAGTAPASPTPRSTTSTPALDDAVRPRTVAPPARRHDPNARVAAALARLDRRAQVAQLFVVGVPLDRPGGRRRPGPRRASAGVFLAGRSTLSAADLASVTAGWQALAAGPRPVDGRRPGGRPACRPSRAPGFALLPTRADAGRRCRPAALAGLAAGMGASLHSAGREPRPGPGGRRGAGRHRARQRADRASSTGSTAAPRAAVGAGGRHGRRRAGRARASPRRSSTSRAWAGSAGNTDTSRRHRHRDHGRGRPGARSSADAGRAPPPTRS